MAPAIRAARTAPVRAPASGAPGGSDDDLFVWNDLRPPARGRDDGGGPLHPVRAIGARRVRGPRPAPATAARAASGDWRAPEYPTGPGRPRYEPADGYETSEEWEEWLEPEAPHGPETIGPLPERHKGPRRRRLSAGAVLLAMLLGFFLAGLLDVRNIKKDVEARPYGALRSLQLALLAPMTGAERRCCAPTTSAPRSPTRSAAASSSTTRSPRSRRPRSPSGRATITQKKPLRLYVAGDSMDQVFGSSLVNLARRRRS